MVAVKTIDELLPQTQCKECGYGGCLPYAEALAQGGVPINRCPPGGETTVKALGELLGVDATSYLAEARLNTRAPMVASIREEECIGCTKCIQACPVDAIVGSGKLMHSIISHECTGCGLCVEPCPVDCIEMLPLAAPTYDKNFARQRFNARKARLLREEQEKQQAYRQKRHLVKKAEDTTLQDVKAKQAYILQALARVQAKKNNE
ncbi:RnfABCDGE type electron transport complex subunit B [Legionella jamestowniensis]|uniref:Electron transport complex protein n=1 Tax=Legionella jamestowniensis TaxID=455 RepID=A0A0W0UIX0_9GAMM|nr:RnfABCDGE type electron transport complex subunit B [Legionella jamestowniensis]KTD07840.1 electron transport complex protein [Legionella jamestowniensis]OCH99109.1 [Fe-S]-binding protein [Legionella jamestowniensis]SFL62936.1 electron transport complex protein RnfB [Legionella jamestowniensis DSM 19215]